MHSLTIVFDLDGTLVDTAPDLVSATNHALEALDLDPVPQKILETWVSHGARRMIVEGLRHTGIDLPDAGIDWLLARFLAHYEANIANESRPFDGAVDALAQFKAMGARLAVCTNKRERLSHALLEALEIAHFFDAVAGRDTFDVCKPHPGHLIGAVKKAGGETSAAIMVGDTRVDVEAALSAGIPAVAVTFGYSDVPAATLGAHKTIEHFDQLAGAVAALRPRPVPIPPS